MASPPTENTGQHQVPASMDSAPDAIPSSTIVSFPLFPQLPPELRFIVWKQFALPKGPMFRKNIFSLPSATIHNINDTNTATVSDSLLLSLYFTGEPFREIFILTLDTYLDMFPNVYSRQPRVISFPIIHPDAVSTVRRLMQVSREARHEVLNRRQLQRLYPEAFDKPSVRPKFFFVNWDLDLFYIIFDSEKKIVNYIKESALSNIKNIAFEIDSPFQIDNEEATIKAPSYMLKSHGVFRHIGPSKELLKSVERLVLLVSFYTVTLEMYITSPEIRKSAELYNMDEDRTRWDNKDWPTNEFGLHTIDTASYHYGAFKALMLYEGDEPNMTFSRWVRLMVDEAKEDALHNLFRHEVECQMMMDHLGLEVEGYIRSQSMAVSIAI
ncbi:hypothetical protein HD806DRAFT_544719 [Xylariaceae sp. AK1471]|nr:hypothetical protein HD806DRAFT_544719 [Xylariaceae sp. AK1471]